MKRNNERRERNVAKKEKIKHTVFDMEENIDEHGVFCFEEEDR